MASVIRNTSGCSLIFMASCVSIPGVLASSCDEPAYQSCYHLGTDIENSSRFVDSAKIGLKSIECVKPSDIEEILGKISDCSAGRDWPRGLSQNNAVALFNSNIRPLIERAFVSKVTQRAAAELDRVERFSAEGHASDADFAQARANKRDLVGSLFEDDDSGPSDPSPESVELRVSQAEAMNREARERKTAEGLKRFWRQVTPLIDQLELLAERGEVPQERFRKVWEFVAQIKAEEGLADEQIGASALNARLLVAERRNAEVAKSTKEQEEQRCKSILLANGFPRSWVERNASLVLGVGDWISVSAIACLAEKANVQVLYSSGWFSGSAISLRTEGGKETHIYVDEVDQGGSLLLSPTSVDVEGVVARGDPVRVAATAHLAIIQYFQDSH